MAVSFLKYFSSFVVGESPREVDLSPLTLCGSPLGVIPGKAESTRAQNQNATLDPKHVYFLNEM